jgi:hypothetical protein
VGTATETPRKQRKEKKDMKEKAKKGAGERKESISLLD